MGSTIAFVHIKGGTGKTTSCINVAGWLAKWGKRVLVVDLDPQANATSGLGIDPKYLEYSIHDVFFNQERMKDVILETPSGIHLIPSSTDLLGAELEMSNLKENGYYLLAHALSDIIESYDYVLIDVSPGSLPLITNAIVASSNIIVPFDGSVFAYETLEALKRVLVEISEDMRIDTNILFLLLKEDPVAMFSLSPPTKTTGLISDFFARNCGEAPKILTIPYSSKVFKSQVKGVPISHYAPFSAVGRAYKKVSKEVVKACEG